MLFLNKADEITQEKLNFFSKHIDFINRFLPEKIKNYIVTFLTSQEQDTFSLNDDDWAQLKAIDCDQELLFSIIYVCYRTINFQWFDLFKYINKSNHSNINYHSKAILFQENDTSYNIRQCRPDKNKYMYDAIVNVSLYNRNQNFIYSCYDHDDAKKYIQKELGTKTLNVFNKLTVPQGQSDFFLIASLYAEGGVSADVCSVAQANIELLIRNCDLFIVYDKYGIDKKFIFAKKHNKFIEYYLYHLITKVDKFGSDQDYNSFSSRIVFHYAFLDFFAFRYDEIKKLKINFLSNDIFTAFVRADASEEELSQSKNFPKTAIKGAFRKSYLSKIYPTNSVVKSTNNYYMPPSNNIIITNAKKDGPGSHTFVNINKAAYSLSSLEVWDVENVALSGHGALWKNGKFLDLEAYLCNVVENETRAGFWRIPTANNITRNIEEDCIVAISAGYGCYGHYLVDDLPRLSLIKDYLGAEFFNKKLVISHMTPEWAKNLFKFFLGVSDENFLIFNHESEILNLKRVFLSSYPHKEYNFHPYLREFYTRFSTKDVKPFRKVCLSRKAWEPNKTHQRIFKSQELFEDLAASRGFEIIRPETMPLEDQIRLMSETACQVGEHGSAQHASIYNYFGNTIVGTINPLNEVQSSLGRIYNDVNIMCDADSTYKDEHSNTYFDVHANNLLKFFDKIEEEYQKRK